MVVDDDEEEQSNSNGQCTLLSRPLLVLSPPSCEASFSIQIDENLSQHGPRIECVITGTL